MSEQIEGVQVKRKKRVLVIECDEPPEAPCKVSVCTMDNLQVMFYAKVNYFGIEEREA